MGASHCSLSPIVHPRVGTALVLCNPYHARKRSRQSLSQVAKRKSKPMRESRPNGRWEPSQNTAAQEATEARRDDPPFGQVFDYNYTILPPQRTTIQAREDPHSIHQHHGASSAEASLSTFHQYHIRRTQRTPKSNNYHTFTRREMG
jgi:hypothetical protein